MTASPEPQSVAHDAPARPATAGAGVAAPGLGLGWAGVAQAVAAQLPAETIERIWLFAPVRREWREWGTAVIARRLDGGRLRVHTASYLMVIRGRERGQGRIVVEEVGESPVEVLHEVIAGVQDRAGEAEPPVEIEPELWYPRAVGPAAGDPAVAAGVESLVPPPRADADRSSEVGDRD